MKISTAVFERDQDFIIQGQIQMALETEGIELNRERITGGVQGVFAKPSRGQYYVALVDDTPIASLLCTIEWSDWRNTEVWWIQSVYVLPEHRGSGVYKKMYLYLQEKAVAEGVAGIRLYVDKTNTRAIQVYEKLGMSNQHYELFEWLRFT
jgi:ribosomal protein S18 acetylase RimI-like enzyme